MLFVPFLTETGQPVAEPLFSPAVLVLLSICVLLVIVLIAVYVIQKKKEKAAKQSPVFKNTVTNGQLLRKFYYVITSIPIFRPFVRRLEAKLKPIYPSNDTQQIKEFIRPLVKIILITAGVGIAVFVFGWGLRPSLYTFVASVFVTYASGTMIAMSVVKAEQNRFKDDFAQLISRIGHYFYGSGNIVSSIELASGRCTRLMKLHCQDFKAILTAEDMQIQRRIYMEKDKDKYLKLFLSQAEIVKRTGNAKDEDGESIFLASMNTLINSIQEDKRHAIDKQYGFIFFGWLAAIPCLLQPYIADWGMYTIGSLASFYVGRSGNLWKIGILAYSFIIFRIVAILQDDSGEVPANRFLNWLVKILPIRKVIDIFHNPDSQRVFKIKMIMRKSGDHNNYRTYYIKKVLWSVCMGITVFLLCVFGHTEDRKFLVAETLTIEDACVNANSKQKEVICQIVPEYMAEYTESGIRPTFDEVVERVYVEPGIKTREVAEDVALLITDKLETYDNDRFDFVDVLIIVLAAVLGFFGPVLLMFVREIVVKDRTADEIVQFQTIVNMMRKLPGILPITILQTMEEFSVVYKMSLRECISSYNFNSMKALETLYFTEKEDNFRMIIEDFMRIPEVGVELAFKEVTSQIKNYSEDRKQQQSQQIEKMTKYAMWMSMTPALLIIFGYMLTPFMVSVVGMFDELSVTLADVPKGG